ncbi:AT-hook motif nuclear-localized protein 10-like isoform X2 [Rutidosis leptorrhynchoides]|uniref:AT-hook motif nuclear-localized protein 10-like isoform X2 n=1 Tax=Rutidosis leptorrhynchoides TaxID=125765 RepID=UPI003A99DF49
MSYEVSNMRLGYNADGTTVFANPNGTSAGGGADTGENKYALTEMAGINMSGNDAVKRKRGRPRKYVADGVMPSAVTSAVNSGDISPPATASGKKRGRPPGSVNKPKHEPAASGLSPTKSYFSGSPRAGFMPHILDVKSGEDVLSKLVWFSQNSTRALCILSASGAISNVTLQQAASGGTVTYEGQFEILSLAGSFMVSETDGQRSRTGGLSVALSGPDGRVLGGNVVGLLTAASPVQLIVGSFSQANQKQSKAKGSNEAEVVNAQANPVSGSLSESSGGVFGSPVGQSNYSNQQGMANMPWR